MARKAGIYQHLWHPEVLGIEIAKDLIEPLNDGLIRLKKYPDYFKQFDAANGWGTYHDFRPWVSRYLHACIQHPKATINTWV